MKLVEKVLSVQAAEVDDTGTTDLLGTCSRELFEQVATRATRQTCPGTHRLQFDAMCVVVQTRQMRTERLGNIAKLVRHANIESERCAFLLQEVGDYFERYRNEERL